MRLKYSKKFIIIPMPGITKSLGKLDVQSLHYCCILLKYFDTLSSAKTAISCLVFKSELFFIQLYWTIK